MNRYISLRSAAVATGIALALSACSGGSALENNHSNYLRGVSAQAWKEVTSIGQDKPAPTKPAPEAEARSALELNKGPLRYVAFESTGYSTIVGMTGQNGPLRTYFTPTRQSIILRNDMVAGTRGFGFDMESAVTTPTERLIRARQSGTAPKVLRHLNGLDYERPTPLTCQVLNTGKSVSYSFAGTTWSGVQMAEICHATGGDKLTNSYIVTANGEIASSRQWVSPQLGYVTIQTVRP